MRPGPRNALTDVRGLLVGQATRAGGGTGVTVVLGEAPMTAGHHVMGGAPGTRDCDLLDPGATVPGVDALFLSGGSAFGLAAGEGVMAALAARGRGFAVGAARVPIVPGAILFDLAAGGVAEGGVYRTLGQEAVEAAGHEVAQGSVGAGAGATTADLRGGIGTASALLPSGAVVGALVAVNALGSVTADDVGRFWAAPWEEGDEFGGLGCARAPWTDWRVKGQGGATTIAVVATDLILTKAEARRMAVQAHDGMARAIHPSHTAFDGDLVFACSTGLRPPDPDDRLRFGHAAATCLARAIARGVHAAAPGGPVPAWVERFG